MSKTFLAVTALGLVLSHSAFAVDHESCNPNRSLSSPMKLAPDQIQMATSIFGNTTQMVATKIGNRFFVEGDIFAGNEAQIGTKAAPRDIALREFRWPNGIVPYVIGSDVPRTSRITSAMKHWEDRTGKIIRFVPRDPAVHADYIEIIRDPNFGGGWSSVGRTGGKQQLGLGDPAGSSVVIHEIGHALGLWHEQSRKDRDQYVRVLWCNIEEKYRHNFRIQNSSILLGSYDYRSVMHYSKWAFSTSILPTLASKTFFPIPWFGTFGTSNKDVNAITCIYAAKNCPK